MAVCFSCTYCSSTYMLFFFRFRIRKAVYFIFLLAFCQTFPFFTPSPFFILFFSERRVTIYVGREHGFVYRASTLLFFFHLYTIFFLLFLLLSTGDRCTARFILEKKQTEKKIGVLKSTLQFAPYILAHHPTSPFPPAQRNIHVFTTYGRR